MNQKYLLFVTFCLLSLLSGNFSQAQNVSVGTRHSCVGDTVSVPIGIFNGQGISAISLSLQAPPNTSLQFLGIDSLNANLSAAQYSVNAANLFAFAWFNLNPVNFNGNLLYLKFKVLTPTVDSFRWDVNNSELADSSATPITSTSFTDGMFFSGVPSTPTFLTATLCQGQSYQVGNQFFGTSGLHSISLTNFAGCDSTVNLNLTIQPADTTRIERVLCPGENTTILGTSYNAPIVIHNNVTTAAGCDSIVEYRVEMMENTLTSTGSCVGSELTATTNAPDVIRATWRKNGQVVSNLVGGYGPNYSTIMGGQFSHATDVFFHEPTGDIYVAEAGAHRVVKITPGSTTPVLVAGGNGAGSTANQLSGPQGIFVSTNGTLFVADAGNHRVQRWLPGSTSGTTVAGGNGAGSLSRQLSAPFDVAVDAQGRIYVSDYNNHRIMRWNAGASSGSVYKSVNHPWGMQLMPNGDLYVAEHHGHLIRRFPANSTTSSVVAVNSTGGCHPTTFVINPMNEILVQWIHCSRQITRHMPDSTQGVKMFDVPYDGYGLALDGTGSLLVGQHHGWDMLRRYNQNTFDTLRLVSNNEGAYTLDLVRRGGCVSVSNAVTVYGVESEVHSDKGALICNGDTAILSTIQQSGYTYQWLKNGLDIPGATSAQIQVFEPGTYMLRSTESHGCQALSEPFVVASPSVTTIQSSGQCLGDSIYFSSSDSTITEVRFYTNGVSSQTLFLGLDEGEVVANGFHHASGLACDAQGNMYISDYHHQGVVKWNLNSTSGSNIAAGHGSALNQVNYPLGLFAAQNGDVYLADFYNHRVLRYIAGSGNGVIVAGGNGEGGGLTQLRYPAAVWVKSNGDVMVADRDNHRIVRWSPGATQGVIVAGTGIAGNAANQLNAPSELFIKDDGTMYVSDRSNHRVQRFAPGSTIAQTVAGGNGQGSTLAQLSGPIGILVDAGNNLFVADHSNGRIVVWPQGSSSGIELANSSLVVSPHSLAFAPDGSLLVTEFAHPLGVKRFRFRYLNSFATAAPQNGVVTATALNRNGCILPVGGSVNISSPEFELLSSKGDILCEGDTSILSVQTSGTYNYQWYRDGQAIAGATGQQLSVSQPAQYWVVGTNTSGCSISSRMYRVNNVPAVSISTNGACGNNAVLAASGLDSSAVAMTWMKNGQAVGYRGVRYEPIGDAWNSTFLPPWDWYAHPIDVVIDPKGEYLYYTSRNNVYRYRLGGGQHTLMAGGGSAGSALGQLSNPGYMVFDKMGRLYLSDWGNHRVLRYDFSSTVALPVVVAGGNGLGHNSSRLYHPAGLYVDNSFNVYVADNYNHRVQRWGAGASSGVTIAGGNGQGPGLNQLSHPSGLKFDEQGNIFVSDQHNHRVMRWSPGSTSGVVVAGGNGAGSAMNQLTYPTDLELDKAGGLIVADHHGHRIIRVAPTSNIGEVIAGGNGVGGSSLQLYHPHGVALDQAGRLYVTDNHNHRVMRYFHYGIDSSVYRPARGGDYQARVYYRNGCYSESNSVHVGNIDTTVLGGPTPVALCQGQSLQVGQQSISTPGYHEVLLTNAAGCDSLVQAFVVVNPIVTNVGTSAAPYVLCEGQSLVVGNRTFTQTGIDTVVLQSAIGCDSTVFVRTLKVASDTTVLPTRILCQGDSTKILGVMYGSATFQRHQLMNRHGCDSVVEYRVEMMENNLVSSGQCAGAQLTYYSNAPDIMRWEWMNGTEVVRSFNRTHQTTSSWNYGSSHPAGMFFHEATGALYLAEAGPHRVLRWLPGATTPQVVAGGNGAGAAANQLSTPRDVFVTANGSIYVVDAGNDRVQRWDPGATQGITVAGGNGRGGLNSQFNDPYGLWVDEQSRIFVADYGNGRVMQWNAGATSGTVYRTGNGPIDVFFDENRNFYMAQHGAHNVLRWSPGATTPVVVANANHPYQIAVDKAGTVYVAQYHAHMISRHYPGNPNGENMGLSFWCHPFGVAITNSGSLYMNAHHCDHTVRRFDLNMNSFPLPDTLMAALPGNYSVRSTRTNGCVSTSNVVAVGAVPQVSILSTGLGEVCMGNTAVVSTTQVSGITYNWQLDGTDMVGETAAQYQITAPGRYRLRATDAQGCTSFSREVIMRPAPSVQLYSSGGCLSDTLSIVTTDSNVASVEWYRDGQVVSSRSARYNTGEALITGMNQAFNVFVDASGNVYSVDRENDRILRRTAGSATAVVVAGGNGRGGALSQLNLPTHVFVDAQGVMFIGDGGNHRVLRWMPGTLQGQVVAGGNGQGGGLSQLNTPHGVWVNGQRQIFVVDHGNHRVMRWNPGATTGTVVAGNNIAGGAANQFNGPTSIQFTPNGDMYIADYSNHRIQRWARGATTGVTVAGGNGQGSGRNQLSNPWGLFVDGSGQIYVSDRSNHRVMRWGLGAVEGLQVGGLEGYGNGDNQLNDPLGIQVDELGRMYLAEGGRGWIRRFTPQVLSGVPYFASSAGTHTAKVRTFGGCLVEVPGSVAVSHPVLDLQSSVGNLICYGDTAVLSSPYDAGYTYRWYKDGQLMTGMSSNSLSINQPGSYRLEVYNAQGCRAVSQILNLFEVPSTNISLQGTCADGLTAMNLTTPLDSQMVAVHWVKGNDIQQVDQRRYEPIGDVEATAHHWPNHLFLGRGGKDLYVSQHNQHRIWKKNLETGAVVTVAGMGGGGSLLNQLNNPHGFYVDSRDNIYVADMSNHRVVRYDSAGIVGVVVAGGNGQGGDSTRLNTPYDTWVDQSGNVYVVDHSNHRIQRWAPGARFGVTVAGGNGQGSGLNQLNHPTQMVMDVNGWMYIADNSNHRVLRWRVGDNAGTVVAGGNGAGGGLNQLYHPHALRLDPSGALYIAENHNHRVVRWRPGATQGEVVLGGQGAGGAAVQLTHPQGIEIAPDGKIYVSDNHNHRVMRYSHYGIDSSVYRPARGGDYQARVYYRNGCYSESNSVHVGYIDTSILGGNPTIASIDFEGSLAGWNTTQTHQWNGSTALGPFSNADITYAQNNLAPHDSLTIEFDFYVHDSWDNHEPFQFSLDGQVLGTYYFGYGHTSSYPEFTFLNTMNSRCINYGGRMYRARFKVAHTSAQMQFRINVWDAEDACNESWSIDNFNVGGGVAVVLCQGQSLQVGQQSISTPGYHEVLLTNAAGCDSLVQAFVVVKPVSQTNLVATICQGQSYTFGNQSLTSSGNYTMNLSNHLDCDSLVTLTLIIQTPIVEHISTSVCSPAVYSFGSLNLTQSGQYVHTFASHAGCDSTVHLNLTVLHPSTFTMAESICQGQTFSFGTQTLTQTGTYTQNLSGVNGCDSLVVLNLNVKPTYSINLTERICSGSTYTFGSQQLSSSGLYTLSLTTHQGCDSIVQLNLLVGSPPPPTVLNEVVCYPSTYTVGNQSFGSSGQYTVVLDDVSGCDSTVVLNLEVRNPSAHTITMTTVGAQFVMVGNQHFNQTGTHIVHLVNAQGCDSVVTLHLTAVPIVVRASNLTTCDGDTILVPLILENAMGISAMSLTLNYPGQNLRYLGYQQVNPTLSQANLLLNATIVNGVNQVRLAWFNLVPVNISSGILLSLRFVVEQPSFSSLVWDLNNLGMCEFADEFGDSVRNMVYHNGLIQSGGSQSAISATLCQGQSYFFDGSARSTTGVYTSNYPDHLGCDSIVVLNLRVNPSSAVTIYDTIPILSTYWVSNQSFTHTGVYQVLLSNQYGCDSVVTLHLKVLGYPLNGRLQYNNSNFPGNSTPMTNTTVNLRVGGQIVKSAQTNSLGQFTFGPVDSNTYELSYSHNKPWGGVNATDALTISRHFTNVIPLTGFRLTAGDVNLSSVVNTSDALLITRRYSNLLSSFPSGNWAYSLNSFHIGPRENLYLDIKSLCYGDVNGSYNPSVNARLAWKNVEELNQVVTQTKAYHLDIKAADDFNLGAASMTLRLPNGVKVESVTALCAASQEPVIFKQEGQILRIAWYHLATWNVRNGDGIFRLGLQGLGEGNLEIEEISSELATENATPIDGLPIAAPRLINKSLEKAPSVVYPNPSSDHATLEFTLSSKAPVDIQIMDAIGKVVWERLGGDFDQGVHRINLPMVDLAQGVYYVILRKESEAGRVSREAIRIQKVR